MATLSFRLSFFPLNEKNVTFDCNTVKNSLFALVIPTSRALKKALHHPEPLLARSAIFIVLINQFFLFSTPTRQEQLIFTQFFKMLSILAPWFA